MEQEASKETSIKTRFIQIKDQKDEGESSLAKAFSKIKDSSLYEEAPENIVNVVNQAKKQTANSKGTSSNSVLVRHSQRGNPVLNFIRNIPWEYSDIIPDYLMGSSTCALFLSLKYHKLNPEYIHNRLKELGNQYVLRILLLQVDIKDPNSDLKLITKICMLASLTLILAWSPEEAGRIIEMYKIFEHKPPDLIMERQDSNPHSMVIDALTTIRSINRTDAMTLLSNFGSLEKIVSASEDELSYCPGLGPLKAKRIHAALQQDFLKNKK